MNRWLRFVWGDSKLVAFYEWDIALRGPGRMDLGVAELRPEDELPAAVQSQFRAGGNVVGVWRMMHRWRRGRVRIYSLIAEGVAVAYGMIQDWGLHSRMCEWLGEPGAILGPAWTDPQHRGCGYHGRLLLHRIHVCSSSEFRRIYTWATASNVASRKGIERAGFAERGVMRVERRFCRLAVRVRPVPDEPGRFLTGSARTEARPPEGNG